MEAELLSSDNNKEPVGVEGGAHLESLVERLLKLDRSHFKLLSLRFVLSEAAVARARQLWGECFGRSDTDPGG